MIALNLADSKPGFRVWTPHHRRRVCCQPIIRPRLLSLCPQGLPGKRPRPIGAWQTLEQSGTLILAKRNMRRKKNGKSSRILYQRSLLPLSPLPSVYAGTTFTPTSDSLERVMGRTTNPIEPICCATSSQWPSFQLVGVILSAENGFLLI